MGEAPEVYWVQRKGGKGVRRGYDKGTMEYERGTKGAQKGYERGTKRYGRVDERVPFRRGVCTKGVRKAYERGPSPTKGYPFVGFL